MKQTVVLDYPPPALNPNVRMHEAKRSGFKKRYRRTCWALAKAAKLQPPSTLRIGLRLIFHPPNAKRRDDDNAESAFKAGRDGLADALGVDDSRFVVIEKRIADPAPPHGHVLVTVEPLTME